MKALMTAKTVVLLANGSFDHLRGGLLTDVCLISDGRKGDWGNHDDHKVENPVG